MPFCVLACPSRVLARTSCVCAAASGGSCVAALLTTQFSDFVVSVHKALPASEIKDLRRRAQVREWVPLCFGWCCSALIEAGAFGQHHQCAHLDM